MMMRSPRWIILALLLALVVTGCTGAVQEAAPAADAEAAAPVVDAEAVLAESGIDVAALPPLVSPEVAQSLLQTYDDVVLLDVRTQTEWDNDGHSPDATLLPLNELPTGYEDLDPNVPVVVVCRSGNRSQAAAALLRDAGFSNVSEVEGGMRAWVAADLPLECDLAECLLQ